METIAQFVTKSGKTKEERLFIAETMCGNQQGSLISEMPINLVLQETAMHDYFTDGLSLHFQQRLQ
ncbi:hypothetical protein J6590_035435 [Homalodisca vitripennis]|nr:hypothetical protein J6590_035435 [Homalodisca vitripennis]